MDSESYLSSINKLQHLAFDTLCLSHFGCITGNEARTILDESVGAYNFWWKLYERNEAKLDDTDYLFREVQKAINPTNSNIKPPPSRQKAVMRVKSALGSEQDRRNLLFEQNLKWLAKGYRGYKRTHTAVSASA